MVASARASCIQGLADRMSLLLQNPLWIAVLAITLVLHVGFAVALWRWTRSSKPRMPPNP